MVLYTPVEAVLLQAVQVSADPHPQTPAALEFRHHLEDHLVLRLYMRIIVQKEGV
jgi:hypothetical protein